MLRVIWQDPIPQNSYLQGLSEVERAQAEEGVAAQGEDEGGYGDEGEEGETGEGGASQRAHAPAPPAADADYARKVARELQTTVRYWSDFLKVHIHPRSLHTLERTNRGDRFDCYAAGTEAFKADRAMEDATDACRHFLEVRLTPNRTRPIDRAPLSARVHRNATCCKGFTSSSTPTLHGGAWPSSCWNTFATTTEPPQSSRLRLRSAEGFLQPLTPPPPPLPEEVRGAGRSTQP